MCHKRKPQVGGPFHFGQNCPTGTILSQSLFQRVWVAAVLDTMAPFGWRLAVDRHTSDRWPAWRQSPQGSLFVFEGLLWLSWGPGLRLPIVCGAGGPEGWRWATVNLLEFLVCPESLVFKVLEGWMGSAHLSVTSVCRHSVIV